MNARATALELLTRWPQSRRTADELLEAQLTASALTGPDRGLVTELFYGCLRQKRVLEFLLAQLAAKPPRPPAAEILALGFYQLFFLGKIPDHAAVHEMVELAKGKVSVVETKFINAVLRRAVQERETLRAKLSGLRTTDPAVFFSHPDWLWARWKNRWGEESAAALCEWNNRPPSIYMRVNTLKAASKPTAISGEQSKFHPLCWKVADPAGIFSSSSWAAGEFYVQDPSTLVAVDVLDPQPGEAVLDMCAAPGGKTTYIAQKMQNRGQIIAADSSAARLGRVGENCRRLGVTIVATIACEGTRLTGCLRGNAYDRVLADVPCSNTGVLRRRPDLRWRIKAEEIARLAKLQRDILQTAAELTKPGGVMVYSTCSLEPEENERVVEQFRESHPRFALETTRSTFPPRDGVDGCFVARFKKD